MIVAAVDPLFWVLLCSYGLVSVGSGVVGYLIARRRGPSQEKHAALREERDRLARALGQAQARNNRLLERVNGGGDLTAVMDAVRCRSNGGGW